MCLILTNYFIEGAKTNEKIKICFNYYIGSYNADNIRRLWKKRKIADLQEKILAYNAQIAEKEDELDRWQSIYNQAKEAYDHSAGFDSYEIEQERSETKGYMDEARREIAKLKRDIAILENSRNINMRALNKLIN